jgi:hypothetical protein
MQNSAAAKENSLEEPVVLAHACDPSTWEAEAGGSSVEASLGYTARLCPPRIKRRLQEQ